MRRFMPIHSPSTAGHRRGGATIVEMAIVAPVTFLLVIGVMIGGLGSFYMQQVNSLAREGARWAALRGPTWKLMNNQPLPTANDVLTNAIKPMAVGIDKNQLTCTLTRSSNDRLLTLVLTYHWVPPAYLSPIQLKSTAVEPVLN